jgi:hypothetical protein
VVTELAVDPEAAVEAAVTLVELLVVMVTLLIIRAAAVEAAVTVVELALVELVIKTAEMAV